MIKRIVNIAKNHKEARAWDIHQSVTMSHKNRQQIAKTLKKRVYGVNSPDVKAYYRQKIN